VSRSTDNDSGYTLVELNLSIAVLGIIMVSILTIFTNYFVIITRNSVLQQMTVDSQSLLRIMTEELRYGAGVRQTNTISDANGPSGGWNTSNTSFVIITAVPAVDSSDQYIVNPDTGTPYLNEFVYYKQGSTMYKRTLANPSATGNSLKTSCPAASASSSCPADIKLINNVASMNFVLYDQDDAITTTPTSARSIVININMSRDTFGKPLTYSNSIRTTLRNTF
jgi:type II secretory pathway pseudopilin PulG